MGNQIRFGAIIAYINIALNLVVNLFLTPFLISSLGDSDYGVYKIIQSFSSQLSIISFGIATLVTRNVVYYNTLGHEKKEEKENFLFMSRFISLILAIIVVCAGAVLYFSIDSLYSSTMTADELVTAKILFVILVANVAITILCDPNNGMVRAHERFVIANGVNTMRIILRAILIIILMNIGVGSIGIVSVDFLLSTVILIVLSIYCRFGLKEKAKFHFWDGTLLKESLGFSFAIFLQAIINQINQNLDNVILGAMVAPTTVTLYSCALTLFSSFTSLVTVIGSMYGPTATKLVAKGADGKQLTEFAIEPSRIQCMIACLALAGFTLFGKNFIDLWLGSGYEDVYAVTLILIIPAMLPLIETVTNNILDAMLKRMVRSIILLGMCAVNIISSIIFIRMFGYIGAAIGTALSYIVGHGILMNIYLYKSVNINIIQLFIGVFKGVLPASIISIVVGIPFTIFLPSSFVGFVAKVVIFVFVYSIIMYFWGMNNNEKSMVQNLINRTIHR